MATNKTVTEEQKPVTEEVKAEAKEKMVSVFVPYIEGEDPEVTLYCNDDNLKFKKGYSVEIPARFAQILQNSSQSAITTMENKKKLKNQRQDW